VVVLQELFLCCQLHKRSTAGESGFVFQNRGKLFGGQYGAWAVRLLVNIDRTVFCENQKVYWLSPVLGWPVHIADELRPMPRGGDLDKAIRSLGNIICLALAGNPIFCG